jgi:hypothetical protein
MHSRRFACLVLGMWLAGGLLFTWLVNENAYTVDRLLVQADPAATLRIKVLGASETGLLLRYEASELTRHEMQLWQLAQIALGGFFLLFLLFGTSEGKFSLMLALVLLICVLVQTLLIAPEIASLGKVTDFLPPTAGSGYRSRLLVMQSAYFAVEIGKWVVMVVLGAILVGRGRGSRSEKSWDKFNVVNKANHGHVDR